MSVGKKHFVGWKLELVGLGQQTPFEQQKRDKRRQQGSPHVAQADCAPERGQQIPLAPVSETLGPVFGDFGHVLAWAGSG